jgi:MFS family permease
VVLSNTTIGVLLSSMTATSLIIALPVIFRGIHLNPLVPSSSSYLLWIMVGYMLVSAPIVVTVGRIGDMFGRVKMYNLGFAWFTFGAILLSIVWSTGPTGALELVVLRMFQAVGGALLMANSAAIITDAFPSEQLGFALGINMVAAIVGSFLGIVVGGVLAEFGWRWVFLANVPIGAFGTVWAYLKLKEIGVRIPARIDWAGNIALAGALGMILVGVTYGIEPYGHSMTGWQNPFVLTMLFGGTALLVAFIFIESKVRDPMLRLSLFSIRAFAAGNLAGFLGAISRGGLMFMLMIWFQGIWLPQHGYSFEDTPLWAGIYLVPFTLGFVVAGPVSGKLSDRYGARPFATGGMLLSAAMYAAMMAFPANFAYGPFAAVMLLAGIGGGLFAAPNTASIMNSVPARDRGAASGMRVTFNSAGMPLSMGLFFTLLVAGLNATVPAAMFRGLVAQGIPAARAAALSHVPPLSYIFAAFLGYNPLKSLLGPAVLSKLSPDQAATLTSRSFFPQIIGPSFVHGLDLILGISVAMSLVAAVVSAFRGGKYVHEDAESIAQKARLGVQASPATAPNKEAVEVNATHAAATVEASAGRRPSNTEDPTESQPAATVGPAGKSRLAPNGEDRTESRLASTVEEPNENQPASIPEPSAESQPASSVEARTESRPAPNVEHPTETGPVAADVVGASPTTRS